MKWEDVLHYYLISFVYYSDIDYIQRETLSNEN